MCCYVDKKFFYTSRPSPGVGNYMGQDEKPERTEIVLLIIIIQELAITQREEGRVRVREERSYSLSVRHDIKIQ